MKRHATASKFDKYLMNNRNLRPQNPRRSRHAFTLVEVLVALGILAILLVIIVLPLRLGFDSFNAGNAQSLTQSALQATMTEMEKDFRQAVYVFPNAQVVGVSDKPPYGTAGAPNSPYYLSTDVTDIGEPGKGTAGNPNGIACSTAAKLWPNPSTLSMIQVRRDSSGNVLTPLAPSYNIVTYYARRQELSKPYDPIDNPVVMYRAEYPAFGLDVDGTPFPLQVQTPTGALNAPIDFVRITPGGGTCGTNGAQLNRSSLWLSHNVYGEADLLPLTRLGNGTDADAATFDPATGFNTQGSSYSHTLAIPRGLALQASNAYRIATGAFQPATTAAATDPEAPLVPDTSFTCTDTNRDGKIDRITISLGLASFQVGAQGELDQNFQPKGTVLRGTRTIDLPNIQ